MERGNESYCWRGRTNESKRMVRRARLRRLGWPRLCAVGAVCYERTQTLYLTGPRDHLAWSCLCCLWSPPSRHAQVASLFPESHKPAVPRYTVEASRPFPTRIPYLTNGGSTVSIDFCKKS